MIILILRVGSILSLNFAQTFAMLNDALLSAGETIEYYIFRGPDADDFAAIYNRPRVRHQHPDLFVQGFIRL